jgi:Raf kinase inhibitor-like YbhB/YbcL family protein
MSRRIIVLVALVFAVAACSGGEDAVETTVAPTTTERPLPTTMPPQPPMELTSPAFSEGDPVPVKYTCDGQNISPELQITSLPIATVTLALIVDDPDAPVGTWDHWVEYDIEPDDQDQTWPEDAGRLGVQGLNSWNLPGYGGPCPPEGENHRYFFKIFALDSELLIPEGVDSDALRTAMEGHILGEAELMATYQR